MKSETIAITNENVTSIAENKVEVKKGEIKIAEVCFGVLMAVTTIYALWCVVSFVISYALVK